MRRKHLIFAVAFSLLIGSFIAFVAVSQQKTIGQLVAEKDKAFRDLYSTSNPKGAWTVYSDAFDVLDAQIKRVIAELEKLRGIKIDSTDPKDNTLKMKKASELPPAIQQALADIETKREEVEDLWLDAYDAWQAYHNAVAAYNSHPYVSPEERLSVPGLDKFVATPLYLCHGPCNIPFETDSLAQVSHQAYCSEKHGKSGTTGVTYWTCFGNTTCQRFSEHWKECRASNCSVMFPPPEHEHEWDTYDHKVKCTECGKKYFTCQSSTCPDSSTHSGSGSGSGGSNPPTDNTPNCPDCTSHCSSPCSCTNSGTCGGTVIDYTENCSGCTTHCSSPCSCSDSGTCNGTVASPPPTPTPTPPPPSGPTCPSGHTYDPNNSSQVDRHMVERTCRRSGCGQTWYRCVGKPASCKVSTNPCWAINP